MGFGISGGDLEWNSPEHWLRSDIQSAIDRGDTAKAETLTKVLTGMMGQKTALAGQEAEVEKQRIASTPQLLEQKGKDQVMKGIGSLVDPFKINSPFPSVNSPVTTNTVTGIGGTGMTDRDRTRDQKEI